MKRAALGLAVFGGLLLVFSFWGLRTKAGQRYFDEMAGMIPFFALVAGGACLVLSIAGYGVSLWRSR